MTSSVRVGFWGTALALMAMGAVIMGQGTTGVDGEAERGVEEGGNSAVAGHRLEADDDRRCQQDEGIDGKHGF